MKIVAFYSGCSGTGKSTSAEHLKKRFSFVRESFAQGIREDAKHLLSALPVSEEQLQRYFEEKDIIIEGVTKTTFRQFMIDYGTGLMREKVSQEYWINRLDQRVAEREFPKGKERLVIDDLRFPNEMSYLRKKGAFLIHLKASERDLIKHGSDGLLNNWSFDLTLDTDQYPIKVFNKKLEHEVLEYLGS